MTTTSKPFFKVEDKEDQDLMETAFSIFEEISTLFGNGEDWDKDNKWDSEEDEHYGKGPQNMNKPDKLSPP